MATSIRGRLVSSRRSKGLTLIELMVAMAIVGLIFALAASGLRTAFNVNLKSSSTRLAAILRYLSNKAVTEHLYLRMVYDLDSQTYFAEQSGDPFVISPEGEEEGAKKEENEEEAQKETEGEEGTEGEKQTAFTQVESKLLKPTKLPSDVFFKDVSVSYLSQKTESGTAYTYFFPDGYATATLINLRNEEDDDHFSIEIRPLSGKVKVEGEYREMEKK